MTIKSIFEDRYPFLSHSAADREAFAKSYAGVPRSHTVKPTLKPAHERGFQFSDLNAQLAYDSSGDFPVVSNPRGVVGIGPWALRYINEYLAAVKPVTRKAA